MADQVKWQYKILTAIWDVIPPNPPPVQSFSSDLLDRLDQEGENGWEVVAIQPNTPNAGVSILLKRPAPR